jgi:hypothetical protein
MHYLDRLELPRDVDTCYNTVKDDIFESIATDFTLTFDNLQGMHPQLNKNCTAPGPMHHRTA